ncbi:hypothetical protein J3Q64DRAFT_1857137 [Phycomyces blakesleeanus]|uniref:Transmembrane protein n=1 Tax=Phycomyces blakesleeanus TaxID=4837 RepID=A0ABR3BE59_PHYBL
MDDTFVTPQTKDAIVIYLRSTMFTMLYLGACLACTTWQTIVSAIMAWRSGKLIHWAVFAAIFLSFCSIAASLISPIFFLDCTMRFWVSIIAIDLGGCCVHTILLYKAYVCYQRKLWVIMIGLIINMGYIALICIYGTFGRTKSSMDVAGNCTIEDMHWQAYAKLGLDLGSNSFLSLAFLLIIYQHYRLFGSYSLRTLLSNGIIFFNLVIAILISLEVFGTLSANLYAIDWAITGYLLIKQFRIENVKDEQDELEVGTQIGNQPLQEIPNDNYSMDASQGILTISSPGPTVYVDYGQSNYCRNCHTSIDFTKSQFSHIEIK